MSEAVAPSYLSFLQLLFYSFSLPEAAEEKPVLVPAA